MIVPEVFFSFSAIKMGFQKFEKLKKTKQSDLGYL